MHLDPYNPRVPDAIRVFEQEFIAWLGVPDAMAAGFGRAALRLGFDAAGCKGATVLLPDFNCAQVVDAAREAGAEIAFYPVERDLTIRTASFQTALTPGVRVAVVPHYFGRVTANVAELAAACRERDVLLTEDCALAWGASLRGQRAGAFGDLAVFSFTKSDWCYGGGVLSLRSTELGERARAARAQAFTADSGLLFSYGLLRRADFLANRPRWSAMAERAGRWLERLAGFGAGNFYDVGKCDAPMSSRSAHRARRLLRGLAEDIRRRRQLNQQLVHRLRDCAHVLVSPEDDPGDTGAFVLLCSPSRCAVEWVEEAARDGVTLRLSWPAFQELPVEKSATLEWLAEHLLILEVHPGLTDAELEQIAACVRRLAAKE